MYLCLLLGGLQEGPGQLEGPGELQQLYMLKMLLQTIQVMVRTY